MPSTNSRVVSEDLPSSTVMTPSLPTFSKASAIVAPMVGSLLALMPATWFICSFEVRRFVTLSSWAQTAVTAFSMPRLTAIGLGPRGDVAQALLVNAQREDGRGGGAVAGAVAGLLGDGVDELRAHVLERVGQVDFLADRDAVLRDRGAAEALVEDDVAAGRPERDADGAGQLVGPLQKLLSRFVGVEELLCHLGVSPRKGAGDAPGPCGSSVGVREESFSPLPL